MKEGLGLNALALSFLQKEERMTKQKQAEIFKAGKQIHPKDVTANVFFGSAAQHETAEVFEQGFSLEGIQDPRVLQQKEVLVFDKRQFHDSAKDFIGSGPDPRDKTAIDFLDW